MGLFSTNNKYLLLYKINIRSSVYLNVNIDTHMANKRFLLGSESQLFEYASTNKPVNITIDQFTRFLHPSIQTDMKAKCIFIKVSVTSILILAILYCIMLKIFIKKRLLLVIYVLNLHITTEICVILSHKVITYIHSCFTHCPMNMICSPLV